MFRSITSKFLLGLALLLPSASWGAAVTFDSSFSSHDASAVSGGPLIFKPSTGNNTTSAGVAANSNRCLIGVVGFNAVQASMGTVTVTWDVGGTAQNLTQIAAVNTGTFGSIYIFGLKNPTAGDLSYTVTWTGGNTVDVSLGGISLYNCDQTTGWNNAGSDTGTGTNAASAVTTTSGDMAIVAHVNQNATSTTINAGSSAYIETSLNGNYAAGYQASSSTTSNVSWTLGSSVAWANAKINVCQSTGCGGGGSTPASRMPLLGVGP